jgi:photosystem II stability/assembly factor-like uncharacterized protein
VRKLVAVLPILFLVAGLAACRPVSTPAPAPLPTTAPTATLTPVPPTVTVTPTRTPVPPLNSPNGPPLRMIRMFTPKDGWGLIEDALLVTHDSGGSWASVPLPEGKLDASSEAFFLNGQEAYLVIRASDGKSRLFCATQDAGVTWQCGPVPFVNGTLTYTDGYLYFMEKLPAGADSMELAVYVSMDKGLTWTQTFPDGSGAPGAALPPAGIKTGLAFIDHDNGWLGLQAQPNKISLYRTNSTGRNWFPQEIPVPQNIDKLKTSTQPPFFLRQNPTDGFLPIDFVTLDNTSASRVFYVTHDAGNTWAPGGSLPEGGAYTFIDVQTGWAWGKRGLYLTTDGARTWLLLPIAFNRSELATDINFIDSKNGWLVTVGQKSRVHLYRTTDGGYSWTTIIP